MLSKYDEEIEGEKKKSFRLSAGGFVGGERERELQAIRENLRNQAQSLDMPSLTLATEYYTPQEMVSSICLLTDLIRLLAVDLKNIQYTELILFDLAKFVMRQVGFKKTKCKVKKIRKKEKPLSAHDLLLDDTRSTDFGSR